MSRGKVCGQQKHGRQFTFSKVYEREDIPEIQESSSCEVGVYHSVMSCKGSGLKVDAQLCRNSSQRTQLAALDECLYLNSVWN